MYGLLDTPDWIVLTIKPASHASSAYYRLHVTLLNLSDRDEEMGRVVSWTVRDVEDPRFELVHASIHPDAVRYLGRKDKERDAMVAWIDSQERPDKCVNGHRLECD